MTTFLYNILLTAGGDRMMETDPHGWTLTLISVTVVFTALIVLYFIYSFSGGLFSGKFKRAPKPKKAVKGTPDAEVAAAIALALDMECSGDEYAAIATAVHLYLNDAIHDVEPGIVTIVRKESAWNNKELNFRKMPDRSRA
ncbi:MAG: OadG family protein [Bacteroidales bacterium]|nr:OadG family protein [Bacteroidales bacterium]